MYSSVCAFIAVGAKIKYSNKQSKALIKTILIDKI